MAAFNSTVDGMGFEEVNQPSYTEMISGTHVYGAGSVIGDIVQGDTQVSGLNIYSTSGVEAIWYSGTMVRATDTVEGDTGSFGDARNAQGTLESIAIGSAPTQIFGGMINAGSGTLGAGSTLSIGFGNVSFTAGPHVVCSYVDDPIGGATVIGSNVTLTGFEAIGDTASKDFNWIAVGI